VPYIQGLPETIRALQSLVRYGAALRRGVANLGAPAGRLSTLDDRTAFEALLASCGLTPPRSALASTPDEAAEIGRQIGFPVALKIVSPDASHKTEVGGVALRLADPAAVRDAAKAMSGQLATLRPGAAIEGFLVQEMVEGLEMIVGVREDPQFGPFLVVGLGGVLVEVIKDVTLRLLPVGADDAGEMLSALRSAPLLGAFRGRKLRDVDALVQAMVGLSRVFCDYRPWLSDIEINPLIVGAKGEGVRAVDVRLVRRKDGRSTDAPVAVPARPAARQELLQPAWRLDDEVRG
jgi:succinyl-CoA synthetase beta subunit